MHTLQKLTLCLIGLPLWVTAADAQSPLSGAEMITAYFRQEVETIRKSELTQFKTKDDFEKAKPRLRQELLEMLGLWPLPAKTDLKAQITGTFESEKFLVEKLVYQSRPGLYVTANLYLPKPRPKNAPVILYLCGHGNIVKDGVSYGSKVYYQRHPAWFATHGYVCMVIDTLQLGEIPGDHHGTYRLGQWWWHATGYTPAGIETWNAIRALDYLETRSEVDIKKLGVTGRSGGGAYSWWLAAVDERPQAIVPVAGIADLHAHLNEGYAGRLEKGVIAGHCDCMFMVNKYRWDFATVAALCAPRPVLLGNSDIDEIFPVPAYRRIAEKVSTIYKLYNAEEKFQLLETKGKHEDTPELRLGAFRWMNRWLKDDKGTVQDLDHPNIPPEKLKVLKSIPEGAINPKAAELIFRAKNFDIPQSPEVTQQWWKGKQTELKKDLEDNVFQNWPKNPPDLNVRLSRDKTHEGIRLRAYDFQSEKGISLTLWLMTAAEVEKPKLIVLDVLDDQEWTTWLKQFPEPFAEILRVKWTGKQDDKMFEQNKKMITTQKWGFAVICPRGVGPTRWAEIGSTAEIQMRRRFPLIGMTLEDRQVWDVRRATQALLSQQEFEKVPLWLQGKKQSATLALYAYLFEPKVTRCDLWDLSPTHFEGPVFLNVLKVLDISQILSLASENRNVKLYLPNEAAKDKWKWSLDLQKITANKGLEIRVIEKETSK